MNTLHYRCTEENGLSFELMVDGQPLGALVGAQDAAIPYWLIQDDLPCDPMGDHPELRIVYVCSCGEYGCGHTQCRVVLKQQEVVFCEFAFDVTAEGAKKEFHFARANYDTVVAEIAGLAKRMKEAH